MSNRVIKDPSHPDFPHATPKGYNRGCACGDCRKAHLQAVKRQRLNRARYGNCKTAPDSAVRRAHSHVDFLRTQVPGVSASAIGRAAGVSLSIVQDLIRDPDRRVAPVTIKKLLTVTPAMVADNFDYVPRDEVVLKVRQMQALGYPIAWQSKQTGSLVNHTVFAGAPRTFELGVPKAIAAKIAELHARVGDTPADSERDGIPSRGVTNAKHVARRNGFYPPAYYNEDGTLDVRSNPDHPWARADERAHALIALVRDMLDRDGEEVSAATIAERHGITDRKVQRVSALLNLDPTQPRYAAIVKDLRTRLAEFDEDLLDPVQFCLNLGVLDPDSNLPTTHPGFVAWWAEHPEWEGHRARQTRVRREQRAAARETTLGVAA